MSNVSIKLEMTKFEGAVISDGFICIPIPDAGTGAKGFFTNKAGERVYLDLAAWENKDDQGNPCQDAYENDYSIKQSLNKDEKEAKVQTPFIGNARTFTY
jgi:hypothetical protein